MPNEWKMYRVEDDGMYVWWIARNVEEASVHHCAAYASESRRISVVALDEHQSLELTIPDEEDGKCRVVMKVRDWIERALPISEPYEWANSEED